MGVVVVEVKEVRKQGHELLKCELSRPLTYLWSWRQAVSVEQKLNIVRSTESRGHHHLRIGNHFRG